MGVFVRQAASSFSAMIFALADKSCSVVSWASIACRR
jgi:hypothetical protein